ncbi:hypothetical protein EMIT091MI3_100073 [Kosakonia quasisacchari]
MSAGTLTLTNNSASVSGSGTSFTTELAAADFIVVTVGGVSYTLPVKTVDSITALTLVSNYTGPTQSGAAWYAVPRVAMNLVTAALVAQSAEALRGLNYDKQNWQQLFTAPGNITVKLPDGTSYPGPSWNYLATQMSGITKQLDGKAGRAANLSDLTDKAAARRNLEMFRTPGRWFQSNNPEVSARFGFPANANTDPNELLAYIGKDSMRLKGLLRYQPGAVNLGSVLITVKPIDNEGVVRNGMVMPFTPCLATYQNGTLAGAHYFQHAASVSGNTLNAIFIGSNQDTLAWIMFDAVFAFLD